MHDLHSQELADSTVILCIALVIAREDCGIDATARFCGAIMLHKLSAISHQMARGLEQGAGDQTEEIRTSLHTFNHSATAGNCSSEFISAGGGQRVAGCLPCRGHVAKIKEL